MPEPQIHACECPNCQQSTSHPDKTLHQQINVFLSRLDEQQRRWYMGVEANRMGQDAISRLALISGLSEKTIARGQLELHQTLATRPTERVRLSGAGRKPTEKKTPPYKRPSKG